MIDRFINIILNVLTFAFIGFLIYLYLKPEPEIEGRLREEGMEAEGDKEL
jgi:uncharacterized membrane protein